jgi:hypothetical protein
VRNAVPLELTGHTSSITTYSKKENYTLKTTFYFGKYYGGFIRCVDEKIYGEDEENKEEMKKTGLTERITNGMVGTSYIG